MRRKPVDLANKHLVNIPTFNKKQHTSAFSRLSMGSISHEVDEAVPSSSIWPVEVERSCLGAAFIWNTTQPSMWYLSDISHSLISVSRLMLTQCCWAALFGKSPTDHMDTMRGNQSLSCLHGLHFRQLALSLAPLIQMVSIIHDGYKGAF